MDRATTVSFMAVSTWSWVSWLNCRQLFWFSSSICSGREALGMSGTGLGPPSNWHTILLIVLWRCWLGGRKGIRPVKKLEWWGTGMVICLERDADLHMAQLMPLPLTISCFSKIQIGFTFLVPAHLGSPGKGPLNGCVYTDVWYNMMWSSTLPVTQPTVSKHLKK